MNDVLQDDITRATKTKQKKKNNNIILYYTFTREIMRKCVSCVRNTVENHKHSGEENCFEDVVIIVVLSHYHGRLGSLCRCCRPET